MFSSESVHGKVLIIDDNYDAAETLANLLGILGCEVRFQTDGLSGVEAAQAMVPDVVLLDVGMPEVDGYETAKLLKKLPILQNCQVVALTAWSDPRTLNRAKASGFDFHVSKPARMDSLLEIVRISSGAAAAETFLPIGVTDLRKV